MDGRIRRCFAKVSKTLEHPYVGGVAASLTVSAILGVIGYFGAVKPLNEKMDYWETNIGQVVDSAIDNKINLMEQNINENVSEQIASLHVEVDNEFELIRNEITSIDNNIIISIDSTGQLANVVKNTYQSDKTIYASSGNSIDLDIQQVVAIDKITGNEYKTLDLENKTIFMSYNENGEEVFFKGQFDENGYWNDNCIINRYKGGKLTMIMDAIYQSGKLERYKQIFPYTTMAGNNVWVVSIRSIEDDKKDIRSGETFMYFRDEEYIL